MTTSAVILDFTEAFDAVLHSILGSVSNNDGDGNENGKKEIDLFNNFARAAHFFVHFFVVTTGLRLENA